ESPTGTRRHRDEFLERCRQTEVPRGLCPLPGKADADPQGARETRRTVRGRTEERGPAGSRCVANPEEEPRTGRTEAQGRTGLRRTNRENPVSRSGSESLLDRIQEQCALSRGRVLHGAAGALI